MKNISRLVKGLLIITLIVAGGCTYTSKMNPPAIAPGSSLKINQSFTDLPNGSRIYFQNGTHRPLSQVDTWSPYCALYVYSDQHKADYITSVQAGEFQIFSVANGREVVNNRNLPVSPPTQMASMDGHGIDLPSYVLYRIQMRLFSTVQPDVNSLTCYQKASIYGDYHPKLGQIKQALGDVIEILDGDG